MSTPRRSFLGRLTALLAVGAAPSTLAAATAGSVRGTPWPNETWLERVANGEHRILIDTGTANDGAALRRALNFLEVMNADYHIPDARTGIGIVMHGTATPLLFDDAMWAKYAMGKRTGLKDAQGADAVANPFRAGAPYTVDALGKRGVQFLACDRSLQRIARELAGAGGNASAIHEELRAHLLPGCMHVPAAIAAVSRAQARGLPYMFVA